MIDALDKFLNSIKIKFGGKANIKNLISNTPRGYFYRSTEVKAPEYIGYRYDYEKTTTFNTISNWVRRFLGIEVTTVFISFYFTVQSASRERTKFLVVTRFPYRQNFENLNILDLPVQIYCECESFMYFMAYALHKTDNLYRSQTTDNRLRIAMTERPRIRNPHEIQFFCKHSIKVVEYFQRNRLTNLLADKYRIKK